MLESQKIVYGKLLSVICYLSRFGLNGVVLCVHFHGFYFCPFRTFDKISIHTQGVTLG